MGRIVSPIKMNAYELPGLKRNCALLYWTTLGSLESDTIRKISPSRRVSSGENFTVLPPPSRRMTRDEEPVIIGFSLSITCGFTFVISKMLSILLSLLLDGS